MTDFKNITKSQNLSKSLTCKDMQNNYSVKIFAKSMPLVIVQRSKLIICMPGDGITQY